VPPRAGLSTEHVVDAAAELADRDGLEALTLAGVAECLGVKPPSLYNHVAGASGLHHELQLRGFTMLRDRLRRVTVGKAGDDAVIALTHEVRAFAGERPGLYAATVPSGEDAQPRVRAVRDEALEVVLAVIAGYGIADDQLIHAARFLRSVVHGFIDLEASGGFGIPIDLDASYAALVAHTAASLRTWGSGAR
jgi:AcrR family transcriptional regulator